MEILEQQAPNPLQRIDYRKIAETYNSMEVGKVMRLESVYNITAFRRSLERRLPAGNFDAYQRGKKCFIKRITSVPMEVV